MQHPALSIIPQDYPELRRLAWSRDVTRPISGPDALNLYERNWRHVDARGLTPKERALIDDLVKTFGNGVLLS